MASERLLRWVADFWLLPVAGLGHELLNPLVDALNPVLRGWAARRDRRSGCSASRSPWCSQRGAALAPGRADGLLLRPLVWALALGVTLYLHRRAAAFDEFLLAIGLFFAMDYSALSRRASA